MKALVTGGTGVLGRELVSGRRAHADVRVLSRQPPRGPGHVQGDLETGKGLSAALDGVDAIAHCASCRFHLVRGRLDVEQNFGPVAIGKRLPARPRAVPTTDPQTGHRSPFPLRYTMRAPGSPPVARL